MKPGTKIAAGISTALLSVGFVLTYDLFVKERINSVEVVVVKPGTEILQSEEITSEKLTIERRAKQDLVEGVLLGEELNQIIGYDAGQLIVSNSMISRKMIDIEDLVPDEEKGEAIRPIMGDMIYGKPGSLRRKDRIDIYLIDKATLSNFENVTLPTIKSETATTTATTKSENIKEESSGSGAQDKNIIGVLKEPLLKNVPIVYAKDSSNKEVTSTEEKEEDKRLNATSSISDLEVILNEADFKALMDEVIGKGSKIYITYN